MSRLCLLFGLCLPLLAGHVGAEAPAHPDPAVRAVNAFYADVQAHTLPNGLRVYLKPMPGFPTVSIKTAYTVGSADEDLNQTGLAHYLEHLMFKGTDKYLPGDIDRLTQRAGGANNAYTSYDHTVYHFDFAADRWEIALEVEADRMRNLRIDAKHEFEQEKGAVIAELDGNEDEPWELENKAILPLLFGKDAPYGHPIIGERKHVRAATAEIIKAFYDRWYHPNNCSIVIVGGFDPARAMARIKELFGPIPSGKLPERVAVAPVVRSSPVSKQIVSHFDVERFLMGFNSVPAGHRDEAPLDVAAQILTGGKTGRLYRTLVREQELAAEVVCAHSTGKRPGWFSIEFEVLNGADRRKAERALLAELEKLADEPVTEAELKRAKRSLMASEIFGHEDIHELADSLATSAAVTNIDYAKRYLVGIDAVSPADIQRTVRKYLDPQKRVVVWSLPPKEDGKNDQDGSVRAPQPAKRSAGAHKPRRRQAAKPAAAPIDLTQTRRVVLPNGLTLLLYHNPRLPIVVADAHVARVRLLEPEDKAGVAKLVGSLLEEGTDRRTEEEISDAIENVGAVIAMTGTGGRIKMLSPDRALGLHIFIDCLTRPKFPREAVKRQREHLLAEIEETHLSPQALAQEMFHQLAYGEDHPLGRPATGYDDSVAKLVAADCRAFHKQLFVPNNTVLTITGDFDPDAIVAEITKLTAHWKASKVPALDLPEPSLPPKPLQKLMTLANAKQLQVYVGHAGICRDNPDYYKLLVMDHILGTGPGFTDRMSAKLRDRQGLGYTVSATITPNASEAPSLFSCYIGTYPDKLAPVTKAIRAEIDAIRDSPPSEQELADAKRYLTGSLPFRLNTNEAIADQLVMIERFKLGLDYHAKFRAAVEAVTAADVRAVARKYLHPDRLILVAVGAIDKDGQPLGDAGGKPPPRPFRPKP